MACSLHLRPHKFKRTEEIWFESGHSSPYYPKRHIIEIQVQTVKQILLKCKESGTILRLYIAVFSFYTAKCNTRIPSRVTKWNNVKHNI